MSRASRLIVAALLVTVVVSVVVVTRLTDTGSPPEGLQAVPTISFSATDNVLGPGEARASLPPELEEKVQVQPAPTIKATSAPSADADVPDLVEVAERGVLAWQSLDDQTRTAAMATLATPAYQEAAATIDATRVPSAPPDTVSLRTEADGQALVNVQLEDGTQIAVIVVLEQDQWLVDDLRPVADPQALVVP